MNNTNNTKDDFPDYEKKGIDSERVLQEIPEPKDKPEPEPPPPSDPEE